MGWYQNIWRPRKQVIVFLEISQEKRKFAALLMKGKSSSVLPEEVRFDSLEELIKHFGKSSVYRLHIEGVGVLNRKIENTPAYRQELIISGNVNDFLFTSFTDGNELVVSFFRKELIQDELNYIRNEKIYLYGLTSGPVPVFRMLENESITMDYDLAVRQGVIIDFKRSEKPNAKIIWRGNHFTAHQLIAKALIFEQHSENESYSNSGEEWCMDAKQNFIQYNQFRTYGVSFVGGVLILLLINYFYQNSLNQELAQMETDLSVSDGNLAMLDRLDQEIIRKKQLITSANMGAQRFLAFYLDEVGESVPSGIQLSEMRAFPVDGKMKNKQKVEVNQNSIEIIGVTNGNEVLDDWIEKLDRFGWIKSVELMNYRKDDSAHADFKVIIRL